MISRCKAIIVCLFAFSATIMAQQRYRGRIEGKADGAPIEGAFIVGLSKGIQTGYTFSGKEGQYVLTLSEGNKIDAIRVSMLGYETKTINLPGDKDPLLIRLSEKTTEIAESRAVAPVIENRGDTLSFYAGAFADGSEKALAELLEKIPEITVTETGSILHNGRYINKFYIEGLDLMGNRYGVVTNNLKAEDVAKIEIYKNHQPVRALERIQSTDRSAVNIILKSGAINSWLLSADVMLGLPEFPLFDGRAMLSRFSKGSQSLFIIKGNNSGKEISKEIREQEYFGKTGAFLVSSSDIETDFTSALNPSKGFLPLPKEYWFDNLSGIASLNHIGKVGKESQLRIFAHVAGEKDIDNLQRQEDIQLQDGTRIVISEETNAADKKGYFNTGACLEKNTRQKYLSDIFSVSGQIRTHESTLDAYAPVNQEYRLPSIKISNTFYVTLPHGDRSAIGFASNTKYVKNNHRAIYDTGEAKYEQKLLSREFLSDNHASLKAKIGRQWFNLAPGIAIGYTGVAASMSGPEQRTATLDAFSGRPYINLGGEFNIGTVHFNYVLPASLNILEVRGADKIVYPSFAPSVGITYKIRDFEFRIKSSYDDSRSDPASLLAAPIMTNYRSLSIQDSLNRKQALYAQASVNYSNVPMRLFANFSGSYTTRASARTVSAKLTEKITTFEYLPQTSSFTTKHLRISAEKFFGAKFLVIKGGLGYIGSVREEYLQGSPISIDENGMQADFSIRLCPSEWISLESSWRLQRGRSSGTTSINSSSKSSDNTIYVTPIKNLSVECSAYWLKEELSNISVSNPIMAKAEIAYSLHKAKLYLEGRNLFNAKEYRREYVSSYTSYSSVFALRPRSFLAGIRMSF